MEERKSCLFVIESHVPSSLYDELTLEGVFPFYLTTDGDKSIIEKKLYELLEVYSTVYAYEPNHEYRKLLCEFLMHDLKLSNHVKVVSDISMIGIKLKGMTIEVWDKNIKNEYLQKNYLKSLKSNNTCRYFNFISISDGKVVKTAKTEDAIQLQKIENKFYDMYGSLDVLAKKLGYDEDKHELVLERVDGDTAQNWYYKNFDYKILINRVVTALHKMNDTPIDIVDTQEEIDRAFYVELVKKIDERVAPCKMLIDYFLKETDARMIDNMPITRDYNKLMGAIKKWYVGAKDSFKGCLCHGDPNTDNTMIDKDGKVVFIDPRGYFGKLKTIGLGLPQYDVAKFCYGLNGYSIFNSAPYIEVRCSCDDMSRLSVVYPDVAGSIEQISLDDMPIDTDTKLIVGIIWMKLTSYIINDPMKSVIAYLYGNAICTKYLKQMGYLK